MARRIQTLKQRAKENNIPVIYANDNFGRWQSNFNSQVQHCLQDHVRGRPIVEILAPDEQDYFVLKPKHSGFYCTALDILLEYLEVETLILAGLAGNICVFFTANDAYLRDFNLMIPSNCSASNTEEENQIALEQMQKVLKADIRPLEELDLSTLQRNRSSPHR
jgi:nicotinamidase-related amidase